MAEEDKSMGKASTTTGKLRNRKVRIIDTHEKIESVRKNLVYFNFEEIKHPRVRKLAEKAYLEYPDFNKLPKGFWTWWSYYYSLDLASREKKKTLPYFDSNSDLLWEIIHYLTKVPTMTSNNNQ